MASLSVRIERKKISETDGQVRHDLRSSKIPNYVDKSKSAENSVLIQPLTGDELFNECKKLRAQRQTKRGIKKNINVAIAGIITFSSEALPIINKLDKARQDELFKDAAKKIEDYLKINITGLIIHRDESSIHAHFQSPAFNREGYPLSDLIGPKELSQLQTVAAEAFKELGIDRGIKKIDRIKNGEDYAQTIHRSVRQLHNDLPLELAKKQEQIIELEQKRQEQELILNQQKQEQAAELQEQERQKQEEEDKIKALEVKKQELENKITSAEEVLNTEKIPEPPTPVIIREKTGWFSSESRKVIDYTEYKAHEKKLLDWSANSFNQNNEKKAAELKKKEEELHENIKIAKNYIENQENLNKELTEKDELIKNTAERVLKDCGIEKMNDLQQQKATEILKNYVKDGIAAVKTFWQKLQNQLSR